MKNFNLIASILLIIFLVSFKILNAQTFNLQDIPTEQKQIGLRFDKAFYSEDEISASTLSGVYELNLNIPISSRFNITAAVPYIYTDYEIETSSINFKYKESGMGNIFIGLQTKPAAPEDKRTTFSFGVFLPTASEKVGIDGAQVNYYYLQKYWPNSLGFYFNYAFHKIPKTGFHYGVEAGPNFLIPTKKGLQGELYLHYGINAGYQVDNFLINAELLGIFVTTNDYPNFDDRFVHLIDFGFHLRGDVLTTKIFYELYLKDIINDYIKGILGIELTLSIN